MERYVHKRRQDGIYVINLEKTWEKLQVRTAVADQPVFWSQWIGLSSH